MSGRAPTATRSSTRTKVATSVIPTTTRATRARTATTSSTPIPPAAATVKKTISRKPLVNRENSVEVPVANKTTAKPSTRKTDKANVPPDANREPIMAFLRIRPHLGHDEPMSLPYLIPLSDTSVRMTDPQDSQTIQTRFRPSTVPPSSTYTFSHVFPPNCTQSDFFTKTTLPLVRDVLQGQNGLLFTYGVTNSGKTYTVQGGSEEGAAGILPRSLDVIFNSIDGLHGDGRFRPVRLYGVEPADATDSKPPQTTPESSLAEVLGPHIESVPDIDHDIDPTIVKVDRNFEFTIWLSYAEVYNEKIFDLLASVKEDSNTNSNAPRTGNAKPLLLTRQALPLKPSPACDNADSYLSGKYVSGLRQFRVHSSSQAKALVKLGQLHRRVFGTLANRESSRSHGMVIIKVMRGHRGEKDDPTSLQISRLTLVDLAGSERTKHTHTTGDRLKEAGNINKSLMVLGQCMEILRSNQRKVGLSLSQESVGKLGRIDTRDVKKGLAVVPFRHSKLTEALMDYFIGDGRTVMIVNVNPYDTGYDENSHVMKFAALAREVYISAAPAPVQRIPAHVGPGKLHGIKIKELGPLTLKDPDILPHPYRRKVTISIGGNGNNKGDTILEVVEEDAPNDEENEDDIESDEPTLIDELFNEVESLRMQLFESEMRCALIEADTREEVMHEMEERMRNLEQMYSRRLMAELEYNEQKTDAKIDMLHHSGLFGSPIKKAQAFLGPESVEEEEDVEMSLLEYGSSNESSDQGSFANSRSSSPSPFTKKGKGKVIHTQVPQFTKEIRKVMPDPPMLPSDSEEAELTEKDDDAESNAVTSTVTTDTEDDDSEYQEDEGETWSPQISSSNKTPKATGRVDLSTALNPTPTRIKSKPKNAYIHQLASDIVKMTLDTPDGGDDSVVILPSRKFKAHHASGEAVTGDENDELDIPVVKKKKRQLGKKAVVTEEEITKVTYAVEKHVAKTQGNKTIRRLRGS